MVSSQAALSITDKSEEHKTIYVDNSDDYIKVKNALTTAMVKYYTYTPRNTKNRVLVLKGISKEFTTDEVKAALTEYNIPEVQINNVSIFKTTNDTSSRISLLVHTTPDSNLNNLRKVRGVLNRRVRWENLRKPKIFQCHNCQRVGHSSANCHMGHRCVKCNVPHEPSKCERQKDSPTPPYCINCNKFGHPANYRGCEYLKFAQVTNQQIKTKLKDNAQAQRNQAKHLNPSVIPQSQTPSQFLNQGKTFADAMRPANPTKEPLPYNGISGQQLQIILGNLKNEIINSIIDSNTKIQQQINSNTQRIDQLYALLDQNASN